jgi:hypothetical protein
LNEVLTCACGNKHWEIQKDSVFCTKCGCHFDTDLFKTHDVGEINELLNPVVKDDNEIRTAEEFEK